MLMICIQNKYFLHFHVIQKMKNNDFNNYISLFKEKKNFNIEFLEKNTKNNNDIKIKFENIKDTLLNELENNIEKL